ncbi:MAG TPA: response regulator, partial [Desulfatiglandales bacterium]|nr:response regulator [Desulfatiglandales bacterium]
YGFETRRQPTKDGRLLDVSISYSRYDDDQEKPAGIFAVIRDISEIKLLEEQLQYAQKMEAIGTLASGIAHNFNNILMGIMGNSSMMLLNTDPANPHYEKLKAIEKLVHNGSKLAKQLLCYAREKRYELKLIDLNRVAKETSDTFGTTKKEITINQDLADDLYGINADEGQIEQVLLNLYVNAADAMPKGGKLFIKTMNVTHLDISGKPYKPKPGDYASITIRDIGVGMDKKTMEQIFRPFFTTKELSNGTGLGLSSTYGIIKAHGGYIDVDSKKGQGTTFKIFLPAANGKVTEENKIIHQLKKGTETVLLVDDEEMILDTGSKMLEALGYKILKARDGKEALEIYSLNKDKIDLVILDIIMPVIGGEETYNRMKEINPKIKVLLSSGYSLESQAAEILSRGCNGFMQKPFSINDLSHSITSALNSR